MLMEITVVDCRDQRDMLEQYSGDAVVFCLDSRTSPEQGIEEVGETVTSQGNGQVRYWKRVQSELELGLVVGKWAALHHVCVYTGKSTLQQSEYLFQISFRSLPTLTQESAPVDVSSIWLSALRNDLLTTLEARFLTGNHQQFHRPNSLMSILQNLAEGLCTSYSRKDPRIQEYLPRVDDLVQRCFSEMKRLGIVAEQLGGVKTMIVEGSEAEIKAWLQQYQV